MGMARSCSKCALQKPLSTSTDISWLSNAWASEPGSVCREGSTYVPACTCLQPSGTKSTIQPFWRACNTAWLRATDLPTPRGPASSTRSRGPVWLMLSCIFTSLARYCTAKSPAGLSADKSPAALRLGLVCPSSSRPYASTCMTASNHSGRSVNPCRCAEVLAAPKPALEAGLLAPALCASKSSISPHSSLPASRTIHRGSPVNSNSSAVVPAKPSGKCLDASASLTRTQAPVEAWLIAMANAEGFSSKCSAYCFSIQNAPVFISAAAVPPPTAHAGNAEASLGELEKLLQALLEKAPCTATMHWGTD
mmetsp:Transcript_18703/g.41634  ORF Transcript_18703/g.41634 Transcript_18703/m.41634 type:complete len:308 (-) Transcript_18703:195-1118(-)